jgi:Tfp pilus assembly protein PilP
MKTLRVIVIVALSLAFNANARGQQKPAPAPQPGTAAAQPAGPPPPTFTYDPSGRRDPFRSLIGRGADPHGTGVRPAGVAGLLINEVKLTGILGPRGGPFVAIIQGPDNKSYQLKAGQKLLDGSVKSITQDTVVFAQDVNDPLSLVKQREIRRTLRQGEGSRG